MFVVKLIWHTYNRGEGKTTDAIKEASDEGAILIVARGESKKRISKLNPKIQCYTTLDVRGLHPTKIVIDEPYEFIKRDPYRDTLRDGLETLWRVYNVPIHLFCTLTHNWILQALYNPHYQTDERLRYNLDLDRITTNLQIIRAKMDEISMIQLPDLDIELTPAYQSPKEKDDVICTVGTIHDKPEYICTKDGFCEAHSCEKCVYHKPQGRSNNE